MSARDLITFGLGPAVSGVGVADWTDGEKEQIRQALGITGTKAATSGGNLDTVQTNVGDLATDSEIATAVAAAILVTPANKLATGATGEASANVTYSAGVPLASRLATKEEMDDAFRVSFVFDPDTAGATYEDLMEGLPESGLTAQQTADAVNNLAPSGTPAVGSIGSHLDLILNGLTGVGLLPLVYTVTVTGTATPIEGVTVEVYTEEACINCVRRGTTNSFGVITFWFTTPGTYWLRREKDGVTFVNPDSEVVSV